MSTHIHPASRSRVPAIVALVSGTVAGLLVALGWSVLSVGF